MPAPGYDRDEPKVRGPATKRAVGYARISGDDRVRDSESLEAQGGRIRSYCADRGWRLIGIYKDEGHSAWDPQVQRPAYDEMMARRAEWDVLVTYKLDRLWRQADVAIGTHEELRAEGKELASVTENMDTTTPAGILMFEMLCIVADLYSSQISERVKGVLEHLFQSRSDPCLNLPPLGYRVDRSKGHPRYVVVPEEAGQVRDLFELSDRGMGLKELAKTTRQRGMVSRRGKLFTPGSLFHILHNPFYCGYVYHRGILKRASHEPIISDNLFNRVQIAFLARGQGHTRLPLMVGEDTIEVEKTVGTSSSRSGVAAYVPRRASRKYEDLLREQGGAAISQVRDLLNRSRGKS